MRIGKPSPAMIVAIIALVMGTAGTGIAAVTNAGKVDGKSAVGAGASLSAARGKLVATSTKSGRLPGKFVEGVAKATRFGFSFEVPDNASSRNAGVADEAATLGLGKVRATCQDQEPAVGVENPLTVFQFQNTTSTPLNFARRSNNTFSARALTATETDTLSVGGSTVVTYNVQQGNKNVVIDAVVRQDGEGTPAGLCTVYGTITTVGG